MDSPPELPPQWLPVAARWCVAQQRCIDLEVARSPEQQRLGLMQRPALPPLRGMWFPFATPQPLRLTGTDLNHRANEISPSIAIGIGDPVRITPLKSSP